MIKKSKNDVELCNKIEISLKFENFHFFSFFWIFLIFFYIFFENLITIVFMRLPRRKQVDDLSPGPK